MTWSVQGAEAIDDAIGGCDLDDSAEIRGDELIVHTITTHGSYNVHVRVKVPKVALLQLMLNVGWIPT